MLLIVKHGHQNRHGYELSAYIKDRFPCDKDQKHEGPDLFYICFCVVVVYSTTFIFTLYRSQNIRTVMFDQIAKTIDNIFTEYLSTSFHIFHNFNIHSTRTKPMKKVVTSPSPYQLTLIIEESTYVPNATEHQANLLDLFSHR